MSVLREWLTNETFLPIDIAVGQLPKQYSELKDSVALLRKASREECGSGYSIQWETKQIRTLGPQTVPYRILIESLSDYLAVIDKQAEFQRFTEDISLIRSLLPQLDGWTRIRPNKVIEYHSHWDNLLRVCQFFISSPKPGCYVRELPVEVHTKFVEQHTSILQELLDFLLPPEAIDLSARSFELRYGLRYDEPLVRVRFLSNQLRQFGLQIDDISLPLSQSGQLPIKPAYIIVVENKITFLTLPMLSNTVAIWGRGFQVVELLRGLGWIDNAQILYWGDIDAHGFQILSDLRSVFPHAQAIMMDQGTFEQFRDFVGQGTPTNTTSLPNLTEEEQTLFQFLSRTNLRLEQEHILYGYATTVLRQLIV